MNRHGVIGWWVGGLTTAMLLGSGSANPLVWAQDEQQVPAEQGDSEPSPSGEEAAEPGGMAESAPTEAGLISIDFKDADIRQVLRIVSLKSGVDIVAGTDVEALVTIKLTNVPWEQALDIVLRTYGFTYERKGNIVRVMTIEALEQEALATEVFPLNYAKAKEVPDIIKEMLSDRGRVKFDERTNTVIVTDIPANLFQIKQVVARLDQRTPQAVIATKVVETRLSKEENLGLDWTQSYSLTASTVSAPSTFPFPGGKNFGELGTAFLPIPGTFSPSTGATVSRGRIPEHGGTFTFGTLTAPQFAVTLNFLQDRTDTHIVSNPTVAVINNQEAKIHIGQEYPIPNYTIDPTTGRTTISGYQSKNVGTVLTVTPHVNPSAEILVDLKPEVITADATGISYSTGQNSSISLPLFTTQTAKTQVRIRSGETIAIGGLVKTSEQRVTSKIPLLGDIPLVGILFKNNRWYSGGSDPNRQDLLIFLTVKLLDEPPPTAAMAATP